MKINMHVVVDVDMVAVKGLHKKTELPDMGVGKIDNKKMHC